MKRILRFIKALTKYIIFGHKVDFNDYVYRLNKCRSCNHCGEWKCNKCGCYLDKKCQMSTEKCPEGNW